jgi:hypothetical protein
LFISAPINTLQLTATNSAGTSPHDHEQHAQV